MLIDFPPKSTRRKSGHCSARAESRSSTLHRQPLGKNASISRQVPPVAPERSRQSKRILNAEPKRKPGFHVREDGLAALPERFEGVSDRVCRRQQSRPHDHRQRHHHHHRNRLLAAPATTTSTATSCSKTQARPGGPSTSTTTAPPATPTTTPSLTGHSGPFTRPPEIPTSPTATSAPTSASSPPRRSWTLPTSAHQPILSVDQARTRGCKRSLKIHLRACCRFVSAPIDGSCAATCPPTRGMWKVGLRARDRPGPRLGRRTGPVSGQHSCRGQPPGEQRTDSAWMPWLVWRIVMQGAMALSSRPKPWPAW